MSVNTLVSPVAVEISAPNAPVAVVVDLRTKTEVDAPQKAEKALNKAIGGTALALALADARAMAFVKPETQAAKAAADKKAAALKGSAALKALGTSLMGQKAAIVDVVADLHADANAFLAI